MKILACDGIHADGLTLFEQAGFSVETSDPIKDASVLAEKLKDFDAVVVRSATLITADALKQATHLKVIGRAGAGVDTIDVEAATARGIAVMNAPDGNTLAAAEHAVSLLFSMARHVPKADAGMKAGEWPKNGLTGFELEGKRLGVIGLGRIGATVARKAAGIGMDVAAFDPFLPRIGRINALFTQVQQLWTAVDSFDTPAMQPNPADGEPATLKIYPPLSH